MKAHGDIVHRKQALVARCDDQRHELAAAIDDLSGPIAVTDRALAVAYFLRAHPVLTGGAVAAVVALRQHRRVGLAAKALAAWRVWRVFSGWTGALGFIARRRGAGSGGNVTP